MFNDLFWALYWIDVLSGAGSHLVGGLLGIGAVVVLACLFTHLAYMESYVSREEKAENKTTVRKLCKLWVWIGAGFFVANLLVGFVPSKQTMYMMLGVKTTDNIVNSETGKKLQEIVNKEIDSYLEKFNKK